MKTVMEDRTGPARADAHKAAPDVTRSMARVGLLTGGDDRSYAVGLATALIDRVA
jgi:hypothetical protein